MYNIAVNMSDGWLGRPGFKPFTQPLCLMGDMWISASPTSQGCCEWKHLLPAEECHLAKEDVLCTGQNLDLVPFTAELLATLKRKILVIATSWSRLCGYYLILKSLLKGSLPLPPLWSGCRACKSEEKPSSVVLKQRWNRKKREVALKCICDMCFLCVQGQS